MYRVLTEILIILTIISKTVFKSKNDLIIENLALRQQLSTYKAKKIQPIIKERDRSFWIALKKSWYRWTDTLIIVKPETVIYWQRTLFKRHWTKISSQNKKYGRRITKKEMRDLIYQMARQNNWGAPRIYSELLMLGFTKNEISQSTVSRYLRRFKSKNPDQKKRQSWITFLKNHWQAISAMDFFVVPTVNFTFVYVFFIIEHARRKILHFNLTWHPTAPWVMQQLREAFPFDSTPKYLIFDRDSIFSPQVKQCIKNMNIKPKLISYQAPWQNGVAERWILSARDDLLNHIIALGEEQLRQFLTKYINYYNNDRCHLSLDRNTPKGRAVKHRPSEAAKVIPIPWLGGLQHTYEWKEAA